MEENKKGQGEALRREKGKGVDNGMAHQ